ncbi:low molecular weight phosphatase family protein [Arthrobacter sp. A5]|uniref:arsenate reductase/protein-tyrosine-phosphatase family protein n=1 Tax=Arthrobacter sp. A5 TaxID=576926 RepID=UPI003DA8F7AA
MTSQAPFRILAVCTGNICRSPMTERLLQHGLDAASPGSFSVRSAGTGALVGSAMDPQIEGYVQVFGASAEGFVSRQLTAEILQGQDLVLALSREHRSRIVTLSPALLKKTFTLRELARILPGVPGESGAAPADPAARWRSALTRALRARTRHAVDPKEDDVVDPYRRDDHVYQQMMRELTPAVRTLIEWEQQYG